MGRHWPGSHMARHSANSGAAPRNAGSETLESQPSGQCGNQRLPTPRGPQRTPEFRTHEFPAKEILKKEEVLNLLPF